MIDKIKQNLDLIIQCLYLSNISYDEPEDIINLWEKNGEKDNNRSKLYNDSIDFINKTNIIKKPYYLSNKRDNNPIGYCQVFFFELKNYLIVSINGLKTYNDIYYCLQFFKSKIDCNDECNDECNNENIHTGFCYFYNLLKHFINNKCNEYILNNKNKKIIFTGHSLGGSIASISALKISNNNRETDVSCITFGSPKIGDELFCNKYNELIKDSFLFINNDDPIAIMPFINNYNYTKGVIYIDENEEVHNENKNTVANSLYCIMLRYFDTHRLVYYYNRINKLFI